MSSFIILLMMLQCVAFAGTETDVADKPSGISLQIVNNGAAVTRVKEGDEFSLQFWLADYAPMTVLIPLRWDPEIVQVIDKKTGEPVTSGRKTIADQTDNLGFTVGSECYDKSADIAGMKLYWNGLPQFSENPENSENPEYLEDKDGYPMINQETGFYKLLYYVYLPTVPAEPQMFLEIHFRALKSGDAGIRFATEADGEGMSEEEAKNYFDIAAKDGLETMHTDSNGESVIEIHTDKTPIPEFRIITEEDISKPVDPPRPPVTVKPSGGSSSGGGGGGGSNDSEDETPEEPEAPKEPEYKTELVDSKPMDSIFPYASADKIPAQIQIGEDMVVDENSEYMVTYGAIVDYLNELKEVPSAVIFTMPDKLIADSEEYVLNLDRTAIDYIYGAGVTMVYAETPYGYIGINPPVLFSKVGQESALQICVSPLDDGINVEMSAEGAELEGFGGNILRVILPYERDDAQKTVTVSSEKVFGSIKTVAQPLPVCRYDEGRGALIFLSPCVGEFTVSERSTESFNDLSEVSWALEQINGLATAGIVQGTGNGLFSPMADVTREQFAKMIVSAAGMYQSELQTDFTDVDSDSVFYPYVVSANMVGLVNGISAEQFGGESCITREDLATICYRAVRLLGIELPEVRGEALFEDDAAISDYAREAVYALYRAGIIDGTGSGFEPKGNTSRAAAAKILHGIYVQLRELV